MITKNVDDMTDSLELRGQVHRIITLHCTLMKVAKVYDNSLECVENPRRCLSDFEVTRIGKDEQSEISSFQTAVKNQLKSRDILLSDG